MKNPARNAAVGLFAIVALAAGVLAPGTAAAQPQPTIPPTTAPPPEPDDECRGCRGRGGTTEQRDVWSRAENFEPGSEGGVFRYPTGTSVFDGCSWDRAVAGEELLIDRPDIASVNITGSIFDEDHWIVFCPDLAGFDAYTIFPVGDPPPAAIVDDMILDAYSRTPVVAFNPITSPDGDEDITLITQMTTFLWVDETEWATPAVATATIPGFSVTVTALPYQARWSGGDEPATCDGDDMEPYIFGIGGDDAQPSNCTMVYKRSTALQANVVELAVAWDVNLTCSIPVCGGPLPDITTNSERDVIVGEIQSVVVASGG